jgi:4'-phosphopantetheinyl transferase
MDQHQQLWLDVPERLILPDDEVHVWRAYLDQDRLTVQTFLAILSPDERERASKFYFQRDREHFMVARGALRIILSRYVNLSPRQIRFAHNRYGKPSLSREANDDLRFNISHAHGIAVYAVTRGREVGIDVEWVRKDFASLEIAERFFSPTEVSMLRALPPNLRTVAFFNCWTRKEAYIKARGEGLSQPLDRFTVSLALGAPALLLSTDDDPQEVARWSLRELTLAPEYVAALAIEGHDWRLRCWDYIAER